MVTLDALATAIMALSSGDVRLHRTQPAPSDVSGRGGHGRQIRNGVSSWTVSGLALPWTNRSVATLESTPVSQVLPSLLTDPARMQPELLSDFARAVADGQ